jgi:hypothetical protein
LENESPCPSLGFQNVNREFLLMLSSVASSFSVGKQILDVTSFPYVSVKGLLEFFGGWGSWGLNPGLVHTQHALYK